MSETLEMKWKNWDSLNPHFYPLFKRFAFEAIVAGRKRLSGSLIIERIRWESTIQTIGDVFKISNSHCAFYTRQFMEDFPQYLGYFATRQKRS